MTRFQRAIKILCRYGTPRFIDEDDGFFLKVRGVDPIECDFDDTYQLEKLGLTPACDGVRFYFRSFGLYGQAGEANLQAKALMNRNARCGPQGLDNV